MTENTSGFGRLRSFFWPIHTYELKKVLPMLLMFFFISFNYSLLRNLKDSLVVPIAGAEILSILKTGFVIPSAILYMIFFAKISNIVSSKNLFYVAIAPFIAFFILFLFVLYPMHDVLQPNVWADNLSEGINNIALKKVILSIKYWPFSLFYIFAELWGSVVLSLLFWGFANDITKVNEAKRFYALFGLGANLALLVSGPIIKYIAQLGIRTPEIADPLGISIRYLMISCITSGLIIMGIYSWIHSNVLTDKRFYNPEEDIKNTKKNKSKISLMQSFKFLASSKYLSYIALLVFTYGISIVLIEVTWKNKLRTLFPDANDYLNFLGTYTTAVGFTTIFLMLFVSSNVMRKFGWKVTALITPAVLLLTGAGFFALILFDKQFTPLTSILGISTLALAVGFGTIQNVMSKAAKYSLFDPTKEMTYIPLDRESKVKGKAAIDVVGSRLGKASGAGIQFILFATVGGLDIVTPHIAIILFMVVSSWIWGVNKLNVEFKAKLDS